MGKFKDIKLLAVLVAAIIYFVLAMVWYGPGLFLNDWANAMHVPIPGPDAAPPISALVFGFLFNLVSAYGIAFALKATNLQGLINGALGGLFIAFVFIFPALVGEWLYAGKFTLFAVNFGYYAVGNLINGAIIGVWQK